MAKGHKITVEAGATLLVDGGTITNKCGEMWDGVWLDGNTQAGDVSDINDVGKLILRKRGTLQPVVE
ncbi:MAG: hypothetical protein RI894_354, partial [Bacteroidota bacterium]